MKYFSLLLFSFIAILPVVSCVITAFKDDEEYASTNVMQMPGNDYRFNTWHNDIFELMPFICTVQ
ncbi:MAG TPA: hypothetical protein VHP81_13590, partial [Lachnospiraceae bacterium]|nr:hypothetical protein [Lachnospiraceae bacterium]